MDTRKRTIAKAVSWQALGLVTMTLLALIFTGSIASAGGLALGGALSGFVCFIIHERVWARIPWGRL